VETNEVGAKALAATDRQPTTTYASPCTGKKKWLPMWYEQYLFNL